MRTPPRRPRITRKAQKASQREAKTPDGWDNWKQCKETFFYFYCKDHYREVRCIKGLDHDGHEHKANVRGGVVQWRTKPARAAEDQS
jgi:hypothetical protein